MNKLLKEIRQTRFATELLKKKFLTIREKQYIIALANRQGLQGLRVDDLLIPTAA
jgi:hypothetical protein